jgi:hypothetical protein
MIHWKLSAILISLLVAHPFMNSLATPMNQERLHGMLEAIADRAEINGATARIEIDDTVVLCISDPNADRMRLIVPIRPADGLDTETLALALAANFHTTLDARYAISGDTLYALFVHPLSSLTPDLLKSALRQVMAAARNFGSTYSSDELLFPRAIDP